MMGVQDVGAFLEVGQRVEASIQDIDWENCGLLFSLRDLERDPLSECVETLFPPETTMDVDEAGEEAEGASLPALASIKTQLERSEGIARASLGRRAVEKGSVSPGFELWLADSRQPESYRVVAREGRLAQELIVSSDLPRDRFKQLLQEALSSLSSAS